MVIREDDEAVLVLARVAPAARRRARVASAMAAALILTACGGGASPEQAAPVTADDPPTATVRVATNGATSDIGLLLAQEYGYFDKLGIKMEYQQIRSAGDIIPLVARGAVDVYASAFGAGFVNAVLGGVDLRVVADKGKLTDGSTPSYGMMLVRSDLADEIQGAEDFKGRTIAWGDPATGSTMVLERYLAEAGLTLDDVRLVTLSMPERGLALKQGAADLANVFEPTGTTALEEGYAKLLFDLADVAPDHQSSVLAVSGEWAADKEDVVTRFLSGYVCAVQDYMKAVESGEGLSDMWKIFEETTGNSYPEGLLDKAVPPALDPEGMPTVKDIEQQIQWYEKQGFTEETVPTEDILDLSYLENRIPCEDIRE